MDIQPVALAGRVILCSVLPHLAAGNLLVSSSIGAPAIYVGHSISLKACSRVLLISPRTAISGVPVRERMKEQNSRKHTTRGGTVH